MKIRIQRTDSYNLNDDIVFLMDKSSQVSTLALTKQEKDYLKQRIDLDKRTAVEINRFTHKLLFYCPVKSKEDQDYWWAEKIRSNGASASKTLNSNKIASVQVVNLMDQEESLSCFLEGMLLANYQFLKYFTKGKDKENSLRKIAVYAAKNQQKKIDELCHTVESMFWVRDMVNEPVSFLTAPQLSKEIESLGKSSGFSVAVFNKKKIESLKMGGLLAVNKGSVDEPRFNILEWKPKNARNKKPVVLVGKGVVYDTGGLSLKPTKGSMDEMKCDMAGAATVAGVIDALSKNKTPLHVIALIPSTDNRPGGNAYTPGDVVTTYSGKTVEVLNTDAEGRVILADALAYAQQYSPDLVMDFATLTGAAQAAIGNVASVVMGTAPDQDFQILEKSGLDVFERVVRFPFWKEYGDMILSDVADIKNVGSSFAGAITAGKFLEVFTKDKQDKHAYPWIHVDIAGPAFVSSAEAYRPKGATAYGVRLVLEFLRQKYLLKS